MGRYVLCVSNEVLSEYEEIIASHTSPAASRITIEAILRANNVLRVDAHFHFGLIVNDPDDNKFVDCAIAANADYIVSDDHHFNVLRQTTFPSVEVKCLRDFYNELCNS